MAAMTTDYAMFVFLVFMRKLYSTKSHYLHKYIFNLKIEMSM